MMVVVVVVAVMVVMVVVVMMMIDEFHDCFVLMYFKKSKISFIFRMQLGR
jgi:hypothetical protein